MELLIQGCMRFERFSETQMENWIASELDRGIRWFDHADIYGEGKCETLFGKALSKHPDWREKMIIQSKCGICCVPSTHYDSSKESILRKVEESLSRLQCGYLDYFLIHRPDILTNPEEIGDAFEQLYAEKKVKHFGVSNFTAGQIRNLQRHTSRKIEVNQLQFSLGHTHLIDRDFFANTGSKEIFSSDGDIWDYCYENDIAIQCWSPFQFGCFEGTFIENEKFPELNRKLSELAEKYRCSKNAIAVAWILSLPRKLQVIIGTTSLNRVDEIRKGNEIRLTREEWYALYESAGHSLP